MTKRKMVSISEDTHQRMTEISMLTGETYTELIERLIFSEHSSRPEIKTITEIRQKVKEADAKNLQN